MVTSVGGGELVDRYGLLPEPARGWWRWRGCGCCAGDYGVTEVSARLAWRPTLVKCR